MLSSILKLLGCVEVTKNDTQSEPRKDIKDSIMHPATQKVTEKVIDTVNDDKLLEIIFDDVASQIEKTKKPEYQAVRTLGRSRQTIYAIWILEAEVNNGGFNQFYYNTGGQLADILPGALKLVGAHKFSELMERANYIYQRDRDKISKSQDGSLEGFSKSYEGNSLNELDDIFYKLYKDEDLVKLQAAFIRTHKQEFIDM